jgi:DNA-3-methyladenine glycosylase I
MARSVNAQSVEAPLSNSTSVVDTDGPSAAAALSRCAWVGSDPLMIAYHDEEWGTPRHDDGALFELLMLDCFQAGLSWATILRKREHFRRAFDGWDPERVAGYGETDVARLLADPGIIRNRQKVRAAIGNARAFLAVRREFGTFDAYLWSLIGGAPLRRDARPADLAAIPARTAESDALSKELRKRGFSFVGSTICYAFMQSVGMVDDHTADCLRAGAAGQPGHS